MAKAHESPAQFGGRKPMFYALFDEFDQTLGTSHSDMDSAEHALLQLGEASGEVGIVELNETVPDMTELAGLASVATGRRWRFDSLKEQLVLEAE
jgi:hypothetical protein